MNALLTKYIDCVITEANLPLPVTINEHAEVITVDGGSLEFISKILEYQKNNHLLVVTESKMIFAFVKSTINPFTPSHFVTAYCSGEWENQQALDEMQKLENTLSTENDTDYCIEEELAPQIFALSDDRIALKNIWSADVPFLTLTKKSSGETWGILLTDECFRKSQFIGMPDDLPDDLLLRILLATDVCRQLHDRETDFPVLNAMLCFKSGRVFMNAWGRTGDRETAFSQLCFHLLFGQPLESCQNPLETMLRKLVACPLPDFFINDLENVYLNHTSYSFAKWETIFARLKLELLQIHQ